MAEREVVVKFVSKKISKIRWRPTSKHVVQKATVFAAGSWDDENNELSVWHVDEAVGDIAGDDVEFAASIVAGEPSLLSSAAHRGDVMDLLFLEQDTIVTASSCGSVFVYKYDQLSRTIHPQHSFSKVHRYKEGVISDCPCTALASRGDERIATVGEDGRLNIIALETAYSAPTCIHAIDNADSCTLNAVSFLTQHEIAAVNSIGQFKIWDSRQALHSPVRVFVVTGERMPLHCMDQHPSQPHIVATGSQDGSLYLWDMRNDKFPITLLSGHTTDMWEVHFHPLHPTHLFTCSNDGGLWHWDSSETTTHLPSRGAFSKGEGLHSTGASLNSSFTTNSWLMGDAGRRQLVIKNLFPGNLVSVNSLDISGGSLVCGTDSEQICVISNLPIC